MQPAGKPTDYDVAAPSYSRHRWAVSWKLDPLLDAVGRNAPGSVVLDAGCGTGDYLHALHERHPEMRYCGFDASVEMLGVARSRCPWAVLEIADADAGFPHTDGSVEVICVVDVLHHLQEHGLFFREAARVLRQGGRLVAITDSEADIRARSLAALFPETVAINLNRYPPIERLVACARSAGLRPISQQTVHGDIPLDGRFLETLRSRALSELRLISTTEHERGMVRAEELARKGGAWLSRTTALEWIA